MVVDESRRNAFAMAAFFQSFTSIPKNARLVNYCVDNVMILSQKFFLDKLFRPVVYFSKSIARAQVAELADAPDLGSGG